MRNGMEDLRKNRFTVTENFDFWEGQVFPSLEGQFSEPGNFGTRSEIDRSVGFRCASYEG